MDVEEYLSRHEGKIREEISEILSDVRPLELKRACLHLTKGGKLLRPLLVLASCEAVGGEPSEALEAAAAVEIVHLFTLIHDDIMDESEERRGVKTVHTVWGVPIAITAGDFLLARAFEMLGPDPRVSTILASSIREVCEGQAMDVLMSQRLPSVTEAEYLKMVEKKTGSLMSAAAQIGAVIGGGKPGEVKTLSEYGRLLGISFQIRDDVLSLGIASRVGKSTDSDIRLGKPSLPILKAVKAGGIFSKIGRRDLTDREIEEIKKRMERAGILEECNRKARSFAERAKRLLSGLRENPGRSFLLSLAEYAVAREK
jgi:geranylgeranyl diphosphate synthase type I